MTELVKNTSVGCVIATCCTQASTECNGNLGTRKVSTIEKLPILSANVMGAYDGVYQGSKFIRGWCLVAQLWSGKGANLFADMLSGQMKEVSDFTQAVGVFNRINVFTSGSHLKNSMRKNVYCISLVIKGVLDTTKWLVVNSVISLGKAAALLSRVPILNVLGRFSITGMSNFFLTFGCIFNVADNALKIMKDKTKSHVREWVSIANDIGKVACCMLSSMAFSYGFAALSIFTASTALFKVGYEDWKTIPNTVPVIA